MNEKRLIQLILFLLLISLVTALCANAGSNCHDTGCRLHGGKCNSACMCIQRKSLAEFLLDANGAHSYLSNCFTSAR